MSSDISKYVQLKRVVAYYLDEENKSMGDFDKCWKLAFRALVDIGFNISFEPVTIRIPVSGNKTAPLPAGYLRWTKIGVINASGEVSTLKINTSLTKLNDLNPNRLSAISPSVPDLDVATFFNGPFFYNYYFGNTYAPYFGIGNNLIQYSECVVDEKNNVIVLSPTYPFPDVLLEYIGSPEKNNDYVIETVCQEAVIAFISWKMKTGSEQDYYARLVEARRKLKPISLQEIQQAIRENQKYSLKA